MLFSEPKIPQSSTPKRVRCPTRRFSALQRAENSSIIPPNQSTIQRNWFQCSSASRKFLNLPTVNLIQRHCEVSVLFSEPKIPQSVRSRVAGLVPAVFQCSSASRKFLNRFGILRCRARSKVSVLFSEPKIPQLSARLVVMCRSSVSVLFSEPKIPQLMRNTYRLVIK